MRIWKYGLVRVASFCFLLVAVRTASAAGPKAGCDSEEPLLVVLELGERGVPLPRSYSADDNSDTRITGTMLANPIFGSEQVVFEISIPAGLGVSQSEAPIIPLPASTPLLSSLVEVVFTTNVTGDDIIGRWRHSPYFGIHALHKSQEVLVHFRVASRQPWLRPHSSRA